MILIIRRENNGGLVYHYDKKEIFSKGIDSGKLHSEDSVDIGIPGIIALCLVGLVLVIVLGIVIYSFAKSSSRNIDI